MHSRVALRTPLGDARSGLYLEVHIGVDFAVLLGSVLDHTAQWLLIERLTPAAHVVYSGLAAKSALARAAKEQKVKYTPENLLDVDGSGVNANEEPDVEVDRQGEHRVDISTIPGCGCRQRMQDKPKSLCDAGSDRTGFIPNNFTYRFMAVLGLDRRTTIIREAAGACVQFDTVR